jgi:hypothetical protein
LPCCTPADTGEDDVPGIAAPLVAGDSPIAFSPSYTPNNSSADAMFSALAKPGNNSASTTNVTVGDGVNDDVGVAAGAVVATVTTDADDDDEPCPPLKPPATDDDDDDNDDLLKTITLVPCATTPTCDNEEDEDLPALVPGNLLGVDDDDDDDDDDDEDDEEEEEEEDANEEVLAVGEVDDGVLATSSTANSNNNNNLPFCHPLLPTHDDPLVLRNQLCAAAAVVNVSKPSDGDTFAKGTTNHTRSYTSQKRSY